MSIAGGLPKGISTTIISLFLVISAGSRISAQVFTNDRVLIKIYKEDDENTVLGINDFLLDSSGILWIAPVLHNLASFDGSTFRLLNSPKAGKVPVLAFSHIERDENGKLFITSENVSYYFRLDQNSQLSFDSTLTANNTFLHNRYPYFNWDRFIKYAPPGEIRRAREGLKNRVSLNKSFSPLNDSSFFFEEKGVSFLYKDSKLAVYNTRKPSIINDELVLTDKYKLMAVDEQSWTTHDIVLTGDIILDRSRSSPIMVLFNSNYPHISYNNRLYRIQVVNKYEYKTVFVCDLSFLHYAVNKVEYYPSQDLTILASQGEGLVLIRPNPFYPAAFSPRFREMKKTRIYYPVVVKERNIFLTSWGEFSGKGHFNLFASRPEGPRCLFGDHTGKIWVGIKNKIIVYDGQMRKLSETSVSVQENAVVDFCEDGKGDIYCLTDHSLRIFKNGSLENDTLCKHFVPEKEVFDKIVYAGNGTFWIGSDNGLYVYDSRDNSVKKQLSLPDAPMFNIAKFKDGSVLVGSYQQDYNEYYYNNRFFKIPVDNQDALKEIMSISEDNNGKIWLSSNRGLFVTTREELQNYCKGLTRSVYYYKYDKTDGVPSVEFNGGLNPSSAVTENGYLVFNSMDGPIVFQQDSIKQYFPDHGFFINLIQKGGQLVPAGNSMELANGSNDLSFQIVVPYYHNKVNLLVEYKINGLQDTWTDLASNGKLFIDHLPHGSFVLSVRVKTGFGQDNYFTREVYIKIDPLFYETVFFKVCSFIVLLSILLFVILTTLRLRSRKREIRSKNASLQQKSIELEEMVGELELAIEETEQSKVRLQENIDLKERLISIILHDLKTPLYFQSLLFSQVSHPDFFSSQEGRELFTALKSSNSSILQFTKDFLTWYSSQKDGFVVRKTEFEQTRLIDDILNVYAEIAGAKKLKLLYEKSDPVLLFTDRNILKIILRNILDNAIKFTTTGHVALYVERQPGQFTITVSDTGKGMGPEKVRILEEYSQKLHAQSSETFGYRFIFTLAEKVEVRIRLQSEPGKGTNVTIIIPDEVRPV
jgi:signal transduction histidine kinase/outer membrane protein assembly factor BamB